MSNDHLRPLWDQLIDWQSLPYGPITPRLRQIQALETERARRYWAQGSGPLPRAFADFYLANPTLAVPWDYDVALSAIQRR